MEYRYAVREKTKFVVYECCDESKREESIASFKNQREALRFQSRCQRGEVLNEKT